MYINNYLHIESCLFLNLQNIILINKYKLCEIFFITKLNIFLQGNIYTVR